MLSLCSNLSVLFVFSVVSIKQALLTKMKNIVEQRSTQRTMGKQRRAVGLDKMKQKHRPDKGKKRSAVASSLSSVKVLKTGMEEMHRLLPSLTPEQKQNLLETLLKG